MNSTPASREKARHIERILGLAALVLLAAAWILGAFRSEAELAPFLRKTLPGAGFIEPLPQDIYAAWKTEKKKVLIGYLAVGSAQGYGGALKTAVAVDIQGKILGVKVVEHRETVSFFARVKGKGLPGSLTGKAYSDPFLPGQDMDSVTGASMTTLALAESVRSASRLIAVKGLGFNPIPESKTRIHFGLAEIALLLFFLVGFIGPSLRLKSKKALRWLSMTTGMVILGFVLNKPLTLAHINRLLLGYWPDWRLHLFFYILAGGVFLPFLFSKKSPYCDWFCPFGATQEMLGFIGGGKRRFSPSIHRALRWGQRILALGAVVLALIYRNPSISSYEVFGAVFHLVGQSWLFLLLGFVMILSLIIRRPWCSYLCPIRPVTDFIRMMRGWGAEIITKIKRRSMSGSIQ